MATRTEANRFGAYEILYELKSGGMGAVLLARRRGPGAFEQLVAIKTIRPEYAGAAAVRAMFLDEAAILARLNHPGVANVHDFGEENGTLYMVMEYVAGIPFRELAEIQPPPAIVARAIAEACRGLHAAHEVRDLAGHAMGLVHRDISPDNLMLGYDGHVKVIDFGIALVKNRQAPVTEFGTVKGKPPYMSPEQVKNEAMDRRSDVFSIAIVLWEMLTRRELFAGDSIFAVAYAVANESIRPPSQASGAALPLGLDAAVMNALDRDLARRTPTAAAFAEQLEQVVQAAGGESLEAWAERELAVSREQHRVWLAGIAADRNPLPKLVGRSSAQVTELGADVAGAMPAAVAPVTTDSGQPTSIGSESRLDVAPRRRLAPIVLLLLLVLAAGGVAVYFATRSSSPAVPVARDAAAPVPMADAPPPIVIAVDAAPPADAAEVAPIDAGRPARDAGRPRRDAAVMPMAADAAVVAGTGYLIAKHGPARRYLNVLVDGHQFGTTPILVPKKLPAGAHVIELVEPTTGETVVHQRIEVAPDQTVTVSE
jgi:predicted Ser/Thr protein kinase